MTGDSNHLDVRCVGCGERVKWWLKDGTVVRRVQGWEAPRSRGGTNAIIARELLGEWAHRSCIEAQRFGQHELFDT